MNVAPELVNECVFVAVATVPIPRLPEREQESEMRTTLLTTTAVAALIGFVTMAAAQNMQGPAGDSGGTKAQGAQQEQKGTTGGAMMHQPSGAQTPSGAAQTGPGKTDQRMGQEEKSGAKPERGAQEGHGIEQRGAQEQHGAQPKGAEEEHGTRDRGAQEQHGVQQKGAQEEHGTQERGAQSENGRSNMNASEQPANGPRGARGTAVQLSQTQRSRIQTIIGGGDIARARTNVHFDVALGGRVPRDVHVEVLPEDVVQIVPQYSGFDYVVVGDEILIIDPHSLEIVAVIET